MWRLLFRKDEREASVFQPHQSACAIAHQRALRVIAIFGDRAHEVHPVNAFGGLRSTKSPLGASLSGRALSQMPVFLSFQNIDRSMAPLERAVLHHGDAKRQFLSHAPDHFDLFERQHGAAKFSLFGVQVLQTVRLLFHGLITPCSSGHSSARW